MRRLVGFWGLLVLMLIVAGCNGTSVPDNQVAQVAQELLVALSARDASQLQVIVTDELVMSAQEYGFADETSGADPVEQWELHEILELIDELSSHENLEDFSLIVDLVRPLTWVDGPIVTVASDGLSAQATGRVRATHDYGVDLAPGGDEIAWFAEYHFVGLVDLSLVDDKWKVNAFHLRPIAVDEARPPDLKLHSQTFGPDGHFTLDDETIFCWGWTNDGGTGWMAYDAWIVHETTGEMVWRDANDFWISADEHMNWWGCVASSDLPKNLMESGVYHIVVELGGGHTAEDMTLMDRLSLEFEHTAQSTTQEIAPDFGTWGTDNFDPDGALAAATRLLNFLGDYDLDGFVAMSAQDFVFHFMTYQDYDEAYYADNGFGEAFSSWDRDTVALELSEGEYFFGLFHPFAWVSDRVEAGVDPETSTGWVLGRIEFDHVYLPLDFGVLQPVEQRWLHQYDVLVELVYDEGRWFVTEYFAMAVPREPSNPPMIKLITSLMTSTGGSRLQTTDEALFCWGWENQGGTGSLGYELTIYKDDDIWGEASDQFWVSANEQFVWWDCVPFPERPQGEQLIQPGAYAIEVMVFEGLDEFELETAEAGMRLFTVVSD